MPLSSTPLLAVLLAAGVAVADEKDGAKELRGTWRLVSVEGDGTTTDLADSGARWVIQSDKVRYGGEDLATLSADASTSPKALDLRFLDLKKTYEGIYAVEKDTLKVCVNTRADGAKERPHVFSSKGKESWRVLTFERGEAEGDDPTDGLPGFVGLQLRFDDDRGELVVDDVLEDSPAKTAGMEKADVILKLGDADATDLRGAVETIRRAKPGRSLAILVRRAGQEKEVRVKVKILPFRLLARFE